MILLRVAAVMVLFVLFHHITVASAEVRIRQVNLPNSVIVVGTGVQSSFVVASSSRNPRDINDDGLVNAIDVTKLERIIAGLDASFFGDLNSDGNVNVLDVTALERWIVGY